MKADYNLQQYYICTKLDTIRYMYLTNLPNTYLYHIKTSFKGPHKSNITKSNSTKIISTKVWLKKHNSLQVRTWSQNNATWKQTKTKW